MEISQRQQANRIVAMVRRRQCYAERMPAITWILAAIAILFQVFPELGGQMSFDRSKIAMGEYWRHFTGHFTHWNADHLIWDVLMFALLGAMIERRNRTCLAATLIVSAASISLAVWFGHPEVVEYRGLSGIDSALFTLVALILFDDARRAMQPIASAILTVMGTAFVGKLVWELTSGATLFVDSSAAGFTPLYLVHAVGGCAGVLAWFGTIAFNSHRLKLSASSTAAS